LGQKDVSLFCPWTRSEKEAAEIISRNDFSAGFHTGNR
jgi:hypothetical protein